MMEIDITKLYYEKYIECLRFYCWQEFGLYDTKKNYNIPSCMVKGSLEYAKNIVKIQNAMNHLRKKRVYDVVGKKNVRK